MLAQIVHFGFSIGEISCPTKYFEEDSSILIGPSIRNGLGVLFTSISFRMQKLNLGKSRIYSSKGKKLLDEYCRKV